MTQATGKERETSLLLAMFRSWEFSRLLRKGFERWLLRKKK